MRNRTFEPKLRNRGETIFAHALMGPDWQRLASLLLGPGLGPVLPASATGARFDLCHREKSPMSFDAF